jgi:hypothetical protein
VIQFSDGRFFVAIGDVSDKGIPAALLMARVMTLLKMLVPTSARPYVARVRLNAQLAVGNDGLHVHDPVRRDHRPCARRGAVRVRRA